MSVVLGDVAHDTDRYRLIMTDDVAVFDTVQSLTSYVDEHEDEDLIVVGPDAPLGIATELAERYRVDRPFLGLVLLRRHVEMQTMAEALRSGIREVVPADDAKEILAACNRSEMVSHRMHDADSQPGETESGKVIVVFSAKGGCGKTTMATNLAQALAMSGVGRVCLVDFNLDFGDVAIALQIDPTRTISDALGMQAGLDQQGVASLVINYKENFDVLLAPTQPADAQFIGATLVAETLGLLTKMYDYIVVDTPAAFNDVVLKCFDVADSYVLLSTLDMLSLKNLKVTLDTLDALGYPRSRWQVVLNRCDSRVGLTPDDVQRTIGVPIFTKVPSSEEVPASLNKGLTLVSEKSSHPFSKAVIELAWRESRNGGSRPVKPAKKRGILHRLGGE